MKIIRFLIFYTFVNIPSLYILNFWLFSAILKNSKELVHTQSMFVL